MKSTYRYRQADVLLTALRPLRVQPMKLRESVGPHDHDYHEVCVVLGGQCEHSTKGGKQTLAAGDVIVVPPDDVHAFDRPRGVRLINVYYLAEWFSADPAILWSEPGVVPLFCSRVLVDVPGFGIRVFRLDARELALVENELTHTGEELKRASPGPAMLKGSFLKVVTTLARAWLREDPLAAAAAPEPAVWQTIQAIDRTVTAGEPFSAAMHAEDIGVAVDDIARLFHAAVGFSPTAYYQRRRVLRACQLLADPHRSITEIAHALSYADTPHFCRLFKTHRGVTPREYRKAYARRSADSLSP